MTAQVESDDHDSLPSETASSSSSDRSFSPDIEDVALYTQIMSDRLPKIDAVRTLEQQVAAARPLQASATPLSSGHTANAQDEDEEGGMIDGRPMTKAEKQNAKKKRRKEREKAARAEEMVEREEEEKAKKEQMSREAMEEEVVSFRLFSCHPVSQVKLLAKQDYPVTANPLLRPYTPAECSTRTRQARASAVEAPSLPSSQSPIRTASTLADPLPILTLSSDVISHSSAAAAQGTPSVSIGFEHTVLALERDIERRRRIPRCVDDEAVSPVYDALGRTIPRAARSDSKRRLQALDLFPRIVLPRAKASHIPRRAFFEQDVRKGDDPVEQDQGDGARTAGVTRTGSSKRRARTAACRSLKGAMTNDYSTGRERRAPRFWAPVPGLGGKARGYAWGYRDSREVSDDARGRYIRSKNR